MTNKVSSYLDEVPVLKALAARLKRVQELQRIYESIVPAFLSRASRIGDVNDNILTIVAFNGLAATGLKQRLPSLLADIQARQIEISAVRVEVQIEKFYTATQQKQFRVVSQTAAESLERLAGALPDSPLQRAVIRLAGRTESAGAQKSLDE